MEIKNKALFKNKVFINNEWIETETTFVVNNPFDNLLIAMVSNSGKEEAEKAISAAETAFVQWKQQTADFRSALLKKWHNLILENLDDLASILTIEQGKPLAEAKAEIKYGASFVEWFSEEAKRTYGDVVPSPTKNTKIITTKQAVGVVAAITPWNFPNAMITRKLAPALAAGCTVVLKPSEETPLSALALAMLAKQAGFPNGVINVLPTNNPVVVGGVLTNSTVVKKISFTGSTAVGKQLMAQSASTLKKLSLELGGNAPFVVFNDASLNKAIEAAMVAKFRNGGQTCIAANRFFIQEEIYDAFVEKFTANIQELKTGNGFTENVTIGPLINTKATTKVANLIAQAKDKGAKIILGGYVTENNCYAPTVVTNVTTSMDIHHQEIFGPVVALYTFKTEEELLALANDTPYGLAAYFFSENVSRIWRVSEALDYGMVGINTASISTAVAPFGGVKESGIGREGSKYGIDEFMELKYLCWGGL